VRDAGMNILAAFGFDDLLLADRVGRKGKVLGRCRDCGGFRRGLVFFLFGRFFSRLGFLFSL
jgi:hypothetical protein